MERECEVTLLTWEQIHGKKQLKMFEKIDVSASITDFAIILGGEFYYFNSYNLRAIRGSYFSQTAGCQYYSDKNDKVCIVTYKGKTIWCDLDDYANGIRPALTFPKNLFIPKKKN